VDLTAFSVVKDQMTTPERIIFQGGLIEQSGSFLKPTRCVDNHRRKRMNSTQRVRNE